MNIIIISVSFAIRESLADVFKDLFKDSTIKCKSDINSILADDLDNIDLIFIEILNNTEQSMNLIRDIKYISKNVVAIALDRHNCKDTFRKSVQLGIDGYILNIGEKEDFSYMIKKIIEGHKVYPQNLVNLILSKNHMNNSSDTLTKREKDVLNELKKGLTNKDIANNLYITEHTVKKHIGNILGKLNLKNRQEAILYNLGEN